MMRFTSALAVGMTVLLSAGCYSYLPVQDLRPGMEIRTRLTSEAALRRSQGLDEPTVRVDGIVVETTPEAVSLDVLIARTNSTFQNVVIRDTVQFQRTELQSILQRKFSPVRTGIFTVGAIAAAYGVVKGINQVVGGGDEPTDPTDPTFREPIFQVPILKFISWLWGGSPQSR